MNYCILNGKKSTLIKGLLIQSLPPISKPLMRTSVEEIDGRDGDIVTKLGYSAYDKQMSIGLFGDYDIDEVIKYFTSEGTVIFSNESDKYYKYQIIAQIDFERLLRFKTAVVTFHVQPFKYSAVDDDVLFSTNELRLQRYMIENSGVTISVQSGLINVTGTATSAIQVYLPINPITISGAYTLQATCNGTVGNSKLRVVGNSSEDSDSFGGTYLQLASGTRKMSATLQTEKTFNFVFLRIESGATVNFLIAPQLFNDNLSSIRVFNRGNTVSRPIFTIEGSGDIRFVINGNSVFTINLANYGSITLDGAEMNAYQGDTLMNRLVKGDYQNLQLNAGYNDITWNGNITQIQIKELSRWI